MKISAFLLVAILLSTACVDPHRSTGASPAASTASSTTATPDAGATPSIPTVSPTPLPAGKFDDPFAYCREFGTVDLPRDDPRYRGPRLLSGGTAGYAWRCLNGRVIACNIGTGFFCMKLTESDMSEAPPGFVVDFCASNKGQPGSLGRTAAHFWSCKDGLVIADTKPVDERGFTGTWEIAPEPKSP